MSATWELAPALQIRQWLNTPEPISLEGLRGRVVVLHAFQMLCPGCVSQGIPQAKRIQAAFPAEDLIVIGLHTVFEHHAVMNAEALHVFAHEYGLSFPMGIDQPAERGSVPLTMQAYALRGTPSLIVLDREGRIRLNHFGHLDDLRLGALLGRLVGEQPAPD
ncbi:MAG TPA: redoxin family protein [Polaromonas sp.]|uniref:peroxiredoxin family protein n=1 Tax=Polaromonas sp. TaxID=1869339 RepID=UPI002D22C44A|nr:redoxin family protein [Polaromonas sp.]HYW56641.1 redoxin family protein [Polaromonas sp.]